MSGLFSIFNVAVRGMTTQQNAINVTSHNIANANTDGYSRQRALIETTRPFGDVSLNNAIGPGQLGTGAEVSTIQRVRDSFLDYQVRNETTTLGQYTSRDNFLSEIEGIVNEPTDTGISSLLGKFYDSWQQLSKQPQSSNARTVVVQQSAALANELNHTYSQLNKLKSNVNSVIDNTVFDVNSILNQVDQLNQQIINVKVGKNEPNDLMDKRDNLLDKLSSKFGINIDKQSFYGEDVTATSSNAPDNADLVKAAPNSEVRRFSYISGIDATTTDGTYKITYYKNGDMTSDTNKVQITITGASADDIKKISENRVLWADKSGNAIESDGTTLDDGGTYSVNDLKLFLPNSGEFKGYTTVHQDTDDYINQVNKLAKALAFSVNALQSGVTDVSTTPNNDATPFFVNSDYASDTVENKLVHEKDITAGNISINQDIVKDVMLIKTRTNDDKFASAKSNNMDGEADGKRALLIADLKDSLMNIQNFGTTSGTIQSRADLFNASLGGNTLSGLNFTDSGSSGMTMGSYFKDMVDKLGVQEQQAQRVVSNQQGLLDSFTQTREANSGVSLDEEMANMIQYQHAYQANAKVISTLDELLDVVINGLKK